MSFFVHCVSLAYLSRRLGSLVSTYFFCLGKCRSFPDSSHRHLWSDVLRRRIWPREAPRGSSPVARSSRSWTWGTSQDGTRARRPLPLCTAESTIRRLEQRQNRKGWGRTRSDITNASLTFEISPSCDCDQKEVKKPSPRCVQYFAYAYPSQLGDIQSFQSFPIPNQLLRSHSKSRPMCFFLSSWYCHLPTNKKTRGEHALALTDPHVLD